MSTYIKATGSNNGAPTPYGAMPEEWDFALGDPDNPYHLYLKNPGMLDLAKANPELYRGINDLRGYGDRLNGMYDELKGMYDPELYGARRDEMLQRQSTLLGNRFSQLGLSGSSAEAGALMEGSRQVDMNWEDRRLNDYLNYMRARQGLTQQSMGLAQQIQNAVLAGQNQQGNFQQQYLDTYADIINAGQAKDASDNSFWSSIIGGGLGAGGYAAAAIFGGKGKGGSNNTTDGKSTSGSGNGSFTSDPYYSDYGDNGTVIDSPSTASVSSAPGYGEGYWS